MEREAFRQRIQQYKQAREQYPQLKYWDWKRYVDGSPGITGEDYKKTTEMQPNELFLNALQYENYNSYLPFSERIDLKDQMQQHDAAIDRYREYSKKIKINPEVAQLLTDPLPKTLEKRWKLAEEYKIPFIEDKQIKLSRGRFNTGITSENVLDSIYNSANRTGVSFRDAIGLAGRESGLGYARNFKNKGYITGSDLYSNWGQLETIYNTNSMVEKYNKLLSDYNNGIKISESDVEFMTKFRSNAKKQYESLRPLNENPIDNALKLFKSGKYNPGDPRHTKMVQDDGDTLLSDPAIKSWATKRGIKLYEDGGEVRDNTYVAPIYKEQTFIPAIGATKFLQDYHNKYDQYKGGNLEIVSPEFDILTGTRGLKATVNNLLDNFIGRKLPSNYAYRRTVQQELDDIVNSNSFRKIPDDAITTGGRTITLPNGKTVTLKKAKGNAHGGKAFSAGDVWKGTTSSGDISSEILIGVPGNNAKWMVGKHGNYQGPYDFSDIEKGSGLFMPFNTEGVADISTEGLKVFKPSKYFNDRYIKYAEGGTVGDERSEEARQAQRKAQQEVQDMLGFIPYVGDAIDVSGIYNDYKQGNIGGAIAEAALLTVPNALEKPIKKVAKAAKHYVPTVDRSSITEQLNKMFGITPNTSKLSKESDWNNLRNRSIERLYDKDVRDRAAKINEDYGVDLQSNYDKIIDQYENSYNSLPQAELTDLPQARAMMDITEEANRRYKQYGIKPKQSDFTMKVDNAAGLSQEVADHEMNHFNQYITQGSPSWNKSDLSKITKQFDKSLRDINPIDPDNSKYFSNWMEQNAYGINMLSRLKELNIEFNKENILKYLKSLPDTDAIKKAALQFKTLDDYIKWLQVMPLAANDMNNEEDYYLA